MLSLKVVVSFFLFIILQLGCAASPVSANLNHHKSMDEQDLKIESVGDDSERVNSNTSKDDSLNDGDQVYIDFTT